MAKYIFKRILTAIPLIIVITILCFSLIHLAPYDAIDAMTTPKMSPEMVQMIREKYGYDQPVYVQYIRWLEGILNGNFGYSIVTKTNIFDELATRIPNTIKLVLPSYLTAYVISIVLGLVAGSHKNKWLDKMIDGICSLWIAMPTFWVAMLFIYLFGYKLRILPILGMHTVGVNTLSDFLLHYYTVSGADTGIYPGQCALCAFFHDHTVLRGLCYGTEGIWCFQSRDHVQTCL